MNSNISERWPRSLRWILPCLLVAITGLLLFQAPSHNYCHQIARGNDACASLPELTAALINGPGLCADCTSQYEYFHSEYFVARLIGVFVFWFWVGWRLDRHQVLINSHTPRTAWAQLLTYFPFIFLCAVRAYSTVAHDRLSMSYAITIFRQSGILVLLQASGKILIERAQIGWLLVLLACLGKEILGFVRRR